MDLPGIAAIRRRARIPKQRDGACLELEFLACAIDQGLRPEILATPDCRIQVGGRFVYVEIRFRRAPVSLRTIRQESLQLSLAEARQAPAILVVGGPGAAPMAVLQSALREIPLLSAIVLWADPLVVVSRASTLRGMPLGRALLAALD